MHTCNILRILVAETARVLGVVDSFHDLFSDGERLAADPESCLELEDPSVEAADRVIENHDCILDGLNIRRDELPQIRLLGGSHSQCGEDGRKQGDKFHDGQVCNGDTVQIPKEIMVQKLVAEDRAFLCFQSCGRLLYCCIAGERY